MRKFTIYDSDRYLLDLNEELKVQENKIGSNSYKLISSFFDNLQILLDKLNESEYWEKGWNGYQDFEDSLSKLSRKEINFINQMLADLNFEVSFNKQSIKSEFRELLRNKRKSFSKRGLNDSSFDSSWGNNNSDDVLFDDEFEQDDWGVQKRESRSRGRTNGGINVSLDLSRLIPKRYKDDITFEDLNLFTRPSAEGREKLVALYEIIDIIQDGIEDPGLEAKFIKLLDELSKSDKLYLESKLNKRFDRQVIIDGLYSYLKKSDISYDESESYDIDEDSFGKSDDEFEQHDWGKSSDGFEIFRKKNKNRRYRTRGGRSKSALLDGFRKNDFSRSISLDDLYYKGKILGNERLSKLYDLVDKVRIGNAAHLDDFDFETVINSLDYSDIQLMEETYGAKFDGKKLIAEFYDLTQVEDKILEGNFIDSNGHENFSKDIEERRTSVVALDYPTIIRFVELKTGVSIVAPYLECLDKLFKDSFSIEKYIEKSNLLISEILSDLNFDKKEISNLIQEHFYLNFDINKDSSQIIDELIGDELRYYQQRNLPKNFHIGDLGSSKIIKKGIIEEDGKLPVFYSEIRSVEDSSYRFNTALFNNCNFSIYAHDGEEIPNNKVDYMIKHKLFSGDLSGLEFYPSVNGLYNVYNINTNENNYTL